MWRKKIKVEAELKKDLKDVIENFHDEFSQFKDNYDNLFMPFAGGINENMIIEPDKQFEKLAECITTLDALHKDQEKIIVMILDEIKQLNDHDKKMKWIEKGRYLVRSFNYPLEVVRIKEKKLQIELSMKVPELSDDEHRKAWEPFDAERENIPLRPTDHRLEELANSIKQQER